MRVQLDSKLGSESNKALSDEAWLWIRI